MSYSNQTTHYGLPLPTGSDKSTWLDTNQAFQAVDAALYAASQSSGADQQAISDLQTRATNLEAELATTNANVTSEQSARQAADATLSSRVDSVENVNSTQNSRISTAESNVAQLIADLNAIIEDLDYKSFIATARNVTNLDAENIQVELNHLVVQGAFSFGNSSTSAAVSIAGTLLATGAYIYPVWTLTATQMNTYFPMLDELYPERIGFALGKNGTGSSTYYFNRISIYVVKLANGSGVIGFTGSNTTGSIAANRHYEGIYAAVARTLDESLPDPI